jgi:hypothetical protein
MKALVQMHNARGVVARWWLAFIHHHQLHAPEHVGPFAGSLLERKDWDHS